MVRTLSFLFYKGRVWFKGWRWNTFSRKRRFWLKGERDFLEREDSSLWDKIFVKPDKNVKMLSTFLFYFWIHLSRILGIRNNYLSKKWIMSVVFFKNFVDRFRNDYALNLKTESKNRMLFIDFKTLDTKHFF